MFDIDKVDTEGIFKKSSLVWSTYKLKVSSKGKSNSMIGNSSYYILVAPVKLRFNNFGWLLNVIDEMLVKLLFLKFRVLSWSKGTSNWNCSILFSYAVISTMFGIF